MASGPLAIVLVLAGAARGVAVGIKAPRWREERGIGRTRVGRIAARGSQRRMCNAGADGQTALPGERAASPKSSLPSLGACAVRPDPARWPSSPRVRVEPAPGWRYEAFVAVTWAEGRRRSRAGPRCAARRSGPVHAGARPRAPESRKHRSRRGNSLTTRCSGTGAVAALSRARGFAAAQSRLAAPRARRLSAPGRGRAQFMNSVSREGSAIFH